MLVGTTRQVAALPIATACWIAALIAAHRCFILADGNAAHAFLRYAIYLTHWTTTLDAVVFSIIAINPSWTRAWWWVGQCVIMSVAMLIGYWAGVSWNFFVNQPGDLQLVHALLPCVIFFYWLVLVDRQKIGVPDALVWLLAPLGYTFWIEAYGIASGDFPYIQLNPYQAGKLAVLLNVAAIFAGSAVFSLALYFADRFFISAPLPNRA